MHNTMNTVFLLFIDLYMTVSSAILQRRLDGTINSLWQSELVEQNPDRCAAVKNSQEQSAISVGEFSGLFIYAGGLMLFGVILHSIHLTSIIDKASFFPIHTAFFNLLVIYMTFEIFKSH